MSWATAEQIEAAAEAMFLDLYGYPEVVDGVAQDPRPDTLQDRRKRVGTRLLGQVRRVAPFLVGPGARIADAAVIEAMQHLIDAWSEFGPVPGPWPELETVRSWLAKAP